jgi:RNA 2',3'-cyclic 3'-phosphodiesterase
VARDRASRPEAKPQRLFVAFDVPDDVRARLADAISSLREDVPGKWVPPQNWHVTVKFLGSTWPRLVDWVHESCARVAAEHEAVETSLSTLGAFPTERRARVLWAGLGDPEERFPAIASALDRALEREFEPEKRAFTAHLTVARFDPPAPLAGMLEAVDVASEPFVVDRLVLYRSHLRRPAPVYEPVGEFPFRIGEGLPLPNPHPQP